jgi:hypothetical protein
MGKCHGLHLVSVYSTYSMHPCSDHCICVNNVCRLALWYELRIHGVKQTSEEAQIFCNWQDRIQKLIDRFELQADGFILHQHNLDIPTYPPSVIITNMIMQSCWMDHLNLMNN